jgi:hypothetical protein
MRRLALWGLGLLVAGTTACPNEHSGFFLGGTGGIAVGNTGTGVHTLQFTVQPTNAAANAIITPAIQVSVLDTLSQPDPNFTNGIAIVIGQNPSGGTLKGTLTVTPVNGVAAFGDLSIDKTGIGYTLQASTTGAVATTSNTFEITP